MNIIYILGTGRTGTTLLGIALSNNAHIFDTGEILKFVKLKGLPHGFNERSDSYKFWQRIYRQLGLKIKINETLENTIHQREYHKYFIKNLFFNRNNERNNERYKDYINNFFDVLEDEIDESIVIDSSKYPGRAMALEKNLSANHNAYYVYIKRNPISVARSFAKKDVEQPSKSFLASNLYYFIVNLFCNIFLITINKEKKISVKYEDFIAKPEEVLNKIQMKFKLDLSNSIELIKNNEELKTGYIFEGNRIRLNESVVLRKNSSKINPKGMKDLITMIMNGLWYYVK